MLRAKELLTYVLPAIVLVVSMELTGVEAREMKGLEAAEKFSVLA